MKIGYTKTIKGEVSVNIQRERLIDYGVSAHHIYDGDGDQTMMDAINSIRDADDQIVVFSGAVIGRWNLKKLLKEMGGRDNTLYSIKAGKSISFQGAINIAALIDDMEAAERRNGGQGGKPPSISFRDHRRIHKMRNDGLNAREITEALGYEPSRHTTVWRYMTKGLPQNKNSNVQETSK